MLVADLIELQFGVGVGENCPLCPVFLAFLSMFIERSLRVTAVETSITDKMFSFMGRRLSVKETAHVFDPDVM